MRIVLVPLMIATVFLLLEQRTHGDPPRKLATLPRTGGPIICSPDGSHVVTNYYLPTNEKNVYRGIVKVWHTASWKEILTMRGACHSCVFSPTKIHLAIRSAAGITVWNLATKKKYAVLNYKRGKHKNFVAVLPLAFRQDGKVLSIVAATNDYPFAARVLLWRLDSGEVFPAPTDPALPRLVVTVPFSCPDLPDPCEVAIWQCTLKRKRLPAVAAGRVRAEVRINFQHGIPKNVRVTTADGKTDARVAISSDYRDYYDDRIILMADRQSPHILCGHKRGIHSMTFSPSGDILASGDAGGIVRLWRVKTGQHVGSLRHRNSTIGYLAIAPNGRYLYVLACPHGEVSRLVIWDIGGVVRRKSN